MFFKQPYVHNDLSPIETPFICMQPTGQKEKDIGKIEYCSGYRKGLSFRRSAWIPPPNDGNDDDDVNLKWSKRTAPKKAIDETKRNEKMKGNQSRK